MLPCNKSLQTGHEQCINEDNLIILKHVDTYDVQLFFFNFLVFILSNLAVAISPNYSLSSLRSEHGVPVYMYIYDELCKYLWT